MFNREQRNDSSVMSVFFELGYLFVWVSLNARNQCACICVCIYIYTRMYMYTPFHVHWGCSDMFERAFGMKRCYKLMLNCHIMHYWAFKQTVSASRVLAWPLCVSHRNNKSYFCLRMNFFDKENNLLEKRNETNWQHVETVGQNTFAANVRIGNVYHVEV